MPPEIVGKLLGSALEKPSPQTHDYGDRYSYRAVLGEGGQGIVVEAHDSVLERDIALKTLKIHPTPLLEDQLRNEAKISAILEHPNIPPTYDLGRDETGAPFFVMRKVEGVSLDEVIRLKSASDATAQEYSRLRLLSIFLQICHAIEYAHSRGVLHLDIKPQNIKLGPFGEVFVLDWGFAARMDETPRLVGGTPIYIAPERLRREPPDERTDVYSLGVMLYRLLARDRPYNVGGLSFKEFREAFDSLEYVPPRQRDGSIPLELDAIVSKAMARNPDDRYQSVHQLAADLQRFLDGVPVSAYRTGPLTRGWKFIRRHSVVSMLVGALVLVSLVTGGILLHARNVERDRRRLQVEQLEQKTAREIRARARVPYAKGRELLERAPPHFESARALFSQAITLDHTFASAYFERAKVFARLGAMNEALADFRQALSLDPSFIMAHYHAGIIQMDEFKNFDAARREFQAMQAIDPGNEYSNLGLARLHILSRRYKEALALCDRILNRNRSLHEVYYLRGFIYGKRGSELYDPDKALDAYNTYLERPTDNPNAFLNRGDLRRRMDDIKGALEDYSQALAINPDHVWSLNHRGWLYYSEFKDTERALKDFNHALEVQPTHAQTYLDRASVYQYLKKWQLAESDYNFASDLRPDVPEVHLRQGECFFRQQRFENALRFFNAALAHAPAAGRARILYRRGLAHYAAGRPEEAAADFSASLSAHPPIPFYPTIMRHIARFENGKNPDPSELYAHLDRDALTEPHARIIRLWHGRITPAEVYAAAKTPQEKCEAFFYVAMYAALVEDAPGPARDTLKKCTQTGVHLYNEYVLAQALIQKGNPSSVPLPARARQP